MALNSAGPVMASAGLSAKPLATGGINREECHDREVAKTSLNITRIYGIYRSSEVQPLSGCSEYTPRPAGTSIRIVNVRLLLVRHLNRDIRAACCRLPNRFGPGLDKTQGAPRTSSVKYGLILRAACFRRPRYCWRVLVWLER
jgi:hypothetical protein